ncbi:CoA pyrophosphatase [Shimia sp.]|uniref:NUDIX hydrolase n=1 Tax=Shimia sp. TaxID=1954381 RepID=UPI0035658092
MTDYPFEPRLRESIRANLGRFAARAQPDDTLRRAAVAIVLARDPGSGQASVLLTLRAASLNRHGGQYALPGGRLDAGESAEQAARRELHEELGLALDRGQVLGRLDDYATRSGFRITPFVLWCPPEAGIIPDPSEVAAVYHIPLVELASPEIPRFHDNRNGDTPLLSAHIPTLGHEIYAPTAALLYQFREVGLCARATRVAHFDQPAFAWK